MNWFYTNRGTRQGDPFSLDLFITLLERVLDKTRERLEGVVISGTRINNMCFADDIDLIDEDEQRLEETVQELNDEGKRHGLNMNFEKTKTMVFGEKRLAQKNGNRRKPTRKCGKVYIPRLFKYLQLRH